MRKSILTLAFLLPLAVLVACSPPQDDATREAATQETASQDTVSQETGGVLGAAQLHALLPEKVAGYSSAGAGLDFQPETSTKEAWASFYNEASDSSVNVFIADLANAPDLYKGFLSARGIVQGSTGNAFGLDTSDRETDFGLILAQSTGRGVVELGQRLDAVRIDLDSITISVSEKEIGLKQVTAELDQATLSASEVEIPVLQVSPSKSEDGSFINVHEDAERDVAGWEIYDSRSKTGALLLGVGDRFGLLIEGSSIDSIDPLKKVLDGIPVGDLEQLAAGE